MCFESIFTFTFFSRCCCCCIRPIQKLLALPTHYTTLSCLHTPRTNSPPSPPMSRPHLGLTVSTSSQLTGSELLWSGQLLKRGHLVKSWKNRYCEIRGGFFLYWRNRVEGEMQPGNPRGIVALTGVEVSTSTSFVFVRRIPYYPPPTPTPTPPHTPPVALGRRWRIDFPYHLAPE